LLLSSAQLDRLCPYLFRELRSRWSREKYDYEFHQHDIGHDHEQRGQDYRARGRAAYAGSASFCPHSLKTRNQPNDQTKHSGLKRGWQEIVETGALKTAIDKLVERERLNQGLRNPAHYQAAKVASEGQQRQHEDASQDAGRRQQPIRVYRGCLDGIDLLGHFHRRQLRTNASAYS